MMWKDGKICREWKCVFFFYVEPKDEEERFNTLGMGICFCLEAKVDCNKEKCFVMKKDQWGCWGMEVDNFIVVELSFHGWNGHGCVHVNISGNLPNPLWYSCLIFGKESATFKPTSATPQLFLMFYLFQELKAYCGLPKSKVLINKVKMIWCTSSTSILSCHNFAHTSYPVL